MTAGSVRLQIVQMNIGAQLFLDILDAVVSNFFDRPRKISVTAKMNQLKRQARAHRPPVPLNEIQLAKRQAPHSQLFSVLPNAPLTNKAHLQRNQNTVKSVLVTLVFLMTPICAHSGRLGQERFA